MTRSSKEKSGDKQLTPSFSVKVYQSDFDEVQKYAERVGVPIGILLRMAIHAGLKGGVLNTPLKVAK